MIKRHTMVTLRDIINTSLFGGMSGTFVGIIVGRVDGGNTTTIDPVETLSTVGKEEFVNPWLSAAAPLKVVAKALLDTASAIVCEKVACSSTLAWTGSIVLYCGYRARDTVVPTVCDVVINASSPFEWTDSFCDNDNDDVFVVSVHALYMQLSSSKPMVLHRATATETRSGSCMLEQPPSTLMPNTLSKERRFSTVGALVGNSVG